MSALALDLTDSGLQSVLVGMLRVVGYLGFVLLAGSTFFLAWLWPQGRVVPIFGRLYDLGVLLVFVSSAAVPLLNAAQGWSSFGGREGALALARMALVAAAYALRREVLGSAHHLRIGITIGQLLLIETYVFSSDAWGGSWQTAKIVATTGHLAATGAWLGGLLTLAAVLIPSTALEELHGVLPKFSIVAIVSVATLVVTGTLHALAIAGGVEQLLSSQYGTALLIKVIVFAAMLILGNVGRKYAEHIGHRKVTDIDDTAPPESIQAFAVAIGAEFALAIGVLAATAALVHLVPTH